MRIPHSEEKREQLLGKLAEHPHWGIGRIIGVREQHETIHVEFAEGERWCAAEFIDIKEESNVH